MSAFIVVLVLVLVASPFCVFMSFNEEEIAFFCVCVVVCSMLLLCVVVCGCAIKNEKMKKKVESKSGKHW